MNKVITINLNGRAYQLEEAGYDALRKYLDEARAKLADNPDADEIMADFESAIADKCDARLSPRKNVVTGSEIEAIIKAMGPVEGGASDHGAKTDEKKDAAGTGATAPGAAPKRLYRLPAREWLAGVCTGLAAYFNIDVTVVRVLFVLLIALSHGFGILLYILLWIVMPVAHTDEERARAHGVAPFNAHDFIERAKSRYEEFRQKYPDMPPAPEDPSSKESWKKWKHEMKNWEREKKAKDREERRAARHDWRNHGWQNRPWQNRPWQDDPSMDFGSGLLRFIMGLVLAALFIFWLMALWSVVHYGTIFGYIVTGHPLWLLILFICAVFYIVAVPFKLMMKNARPWRWGRYSFFNDLMQSIAFVVAIYLVVMIGRELFPVVNQAYEMVVTYLRSMIR